jgi:hypothetical protein
VMSDRSEAAIRIREADVRQPNKSAWSRCSRARTGSHFLFVSRRTNQYVNPYTKPQEAKIAIPDASGTKLSVRVWWPPSNDIPLAISMGNRNQ